MYILKYTVFISVSHSHSHLLDLFSNASELIKRILCEEENPVNEKRQPTDEERTKKK